MTPDERLTKIENAIQALTDVQAKHDDGIRNLIVVSRTLLDAQIRTDAQIARSLDMIQELSEAQKHTDEKLSALIDTVHGHEGKIDALIDTVDRIIRRNGDGQS